MKLRKLMDEPDVELRYGAFNALRTLAADDPFLGQVRVLDDPRAADEEASDSMAVALTRASARHRRPDPFSLYMVDCEGPPMVHVARTRRCEVVVFGRGQKLLTPVVLGTGPLLLNAATDDDSLQISKIVPGRSSEGDAKVQSSLELGDVLRQSAALGASYPEIVSILQAASRQKNLAGPLVVDALPGNSPVYIEAELLGKDTTAKKDDALKKTKLETETTKPKRRSLLNRLFGGPLTHRSAGARAGVRRPAPSRDANPSAPPFDTSRTPPCPSFPERPSPPVGSTGPIRSEGRSSPDPS